MTDTFKANTKSTNGVMFFAKEIKHDNKLYKLAIWDTAGQERYKAIAPLYYKDANAVILVCDASEPDKMMDGLTNWSHEVKEKSKTMPTICVCGNKTDLIASNEFREIEEKLLDYTQKENYKLVMTSAKTGVGINVAFINILESFKNNVDFKKPRRQTLSKSSILGKSSIQP